jgi:hypothetical protein
MKFAKKMRKFGAYIEAEEIVQVIRTELNGELWNVKLFCPKLHTDILGNTAIKSK